MWRKNNRKPPRPSTGNINNNNRNCNLFVPSSSQGSVFGDEDTYSDLNTDFGCPLNPSSSGFSVASDDDDGVCTPLDFQEHYADGALDSDHLKWIEDFILADDEQLGYQSSETNCFSLVTSHGGATASASRNGHVFLETEDDAVDSLPHPLQQDGNGMLNKHTVKGQSSEISNSNKETTDKNDGESWQEASADPQDKSNLIETDYSAETSQPEIRDEKLEIDNCKRKYDMFQLISSSQSKNFLDQMLESNPGILTKTEGIYNLPKECHLEEIRAPGSSLFLEDGTCEFLGCMASWSSFSAEGQIIPPEMHNSHVRFKIKSFTVPEFFIEVPETASVAFFKKAIMEKAIAIAGDGGHLGVVLQSDEIGDDNEILPKTNVSHQNKLDAILEPHGSCVLLPPQRQIWCPTLSAFQGTTDPWLDSLTSILGTKFQDNCENGELYVASEHQRIKASKCKKRLGMEENTLDEKSVCQKSSMKVKRRKTEFFSISEVEALVQTVEELGPGRWQKIKEQAFGNDSRRTYMDVKDKWRSLVKTAQRPVDERRGVCLPQGLLDRVLAVETCKSKK